MEEEYAGKRGNIDIVLNATREDMFPEVRGERKKRKAGSKEKRNEERRRSGEGGGGQRKETRYSLSFEMENVIFIQRNTAGT